MSSMLPKHWFDSSNVELLPADKLVVVEFARANLPTKYGPFVIVAFKNNRDDKDHVALLRGDIEGQRGVPTRVHSECLTGDVFGSLKCDCGEQLDRTLRDIQASESGVLLYMRQEGRGIGLANKVRAYGLQDDGLDTVEANLHLGFDDDLRDYDIAAEMLKILGLESIELLTNNPRKVDGLTSNGIEVVERTPLQIVPNPHNAAYLETKKRKSGHLL